MTIKNFLSVNLKKFDKKDLDIFLMKVLNCDENFLFLNEKFSIPEEKILELENFLKEKKAWYSTASIIWEKYFYWRRFFIDKNVLVPREETEDLISFVKGKIWENFFEWNWKNILEIWVWSWIIPITLILELIKKEFFSLEKINSELHCQPWNCDFNKLWEEELKIIAEKKVYEKNNFFASDISEKALKVAKKNSEILLKNNLEKSEDWKIFWDKLKFFKSDLLKNIPEKINEKFKKEWIFLITANLPYVENKFKTDKNVNFENGISKEPDLSLYSWNDGLEHYRELFEELKTVNFKYLIMEMASWQCEEIAKIFSNFWHVEIYKDLWWNDRWVFVENI